MFTRNENAFTLAEVFYPVGQSKRNAFTLAEVFYPVGQSKRNAFTLAEVLITLGIIGIVAALTMPSIINDKRHKELETAFKKSYSTLAQVVMRTINEDYGGMPPTIDSYAPLKEFMGQFQKYIVKSEICMYDEICSTAIFPVSNLSALRAYLEVNYKTYNGKIPERKCNDGIMALSDGSFLFFEFATKKEVLYKKTVVCVDTNGWRKKPNMYGHDFFMFQVNEVGQLIPMGAEGTVFSSSDDCSITSEAKSNGYGCTAKAVKEKDYFKNLP